MPARGQNQRKLLLTLVEFSGLFSRVDLLRPLLHLGDVQVNFPVNRRESLEMIPGLGIDLSDDKSLGAAQCSTEEVFSQLRARGEAHAPGGFLSHWGLILLPGGSLSDLEI